MKRKILTSKEINDLLFRCRNEDQKSFTKTLRDLERGEGRYCIIGEKGEIIFKECAKIFDEGEYDNNPTAQYNSLRLVKYAVDSPQALGEDYKKPWELYLKTIFHNDGRIRMAGVQLLDRYYFGLSFDLKPISFWQGKKRKTDKLQMEEIGNFLIEKYLYLQKTEEEYLNKHQLRLFEKDLPDLVGTMPWASDTKDKFLKTIRIGMEVFFLRGPLEEIMGNYEYQQKASSEFEDAIIFQRYEKNIINDKDLNPINMKTYIIRAKLEYNKHTYRDIEVLGNITSYDLAKVILGSFNFDFDHLFGFGNKPGFYHSDIQYELKTDDDDPGFYNNNRYDVEKTTISDVPFFKNLKDKMYFLFDFGDNWHFEIELINFGEINKKIKYPVLLGENGKAPEQYPEMN